MTKINGADGPNQVQPGDKWFTIFPFKTTAEKGISM